MARHLLSTYLLVAIIARVVAPTAAFQPPAPIYDDDVVLVGSSRSANFARRSEGRSRRARALCFDQDDPLEPESKRHVNCLPARARRKIRRDVSTSITLTATASPTLSISTVPTTSATTSASASATSPLTTSFASEMFNFSLTCNSDSTTCDSVSTAFMAAGQLISSALDIYVPILVNASFIPFCQTLSICSTNGLLTLGGATPSRTIPLLDSDDVVRFYPQSLVKQFGYPKPPDFSQFDINARFNSEAAFYFGSNSLVENMSNTSVQARSLAATSTPKNTTKIMPGQEDFLFVVVHELIHGLGMTSSWQDYLSSDGSQINSSTTGLTPAFTVGSLSNGSVEFGGFTEYAFDRYLVTLSSFVPASVLAMNVSTSMDDDSIVSAAETASQSTSMDMSTTTTASRFERRQALDTTTMSSSSSSSSSSSTATTTSTSATATSTSAPDSWYPLTNLTAILNQFDQTRVNYVNRSQLDAALTSSPYYSVAAVVLNLTTTANSLAFSTDFHATNASFDASSRSTAISNKTGLTPAGLYLLETSLKPFTAGSSISHASADGYTNTSDFLMRYIQDKGLSLAQNIQKGGGGGQVIGPGLLALLKTLGYSQGAGIGAGIGIDNSTDATTTGTLPMTTATLASTQSSLGSSSFEARTVKVTLALMILPFIMHYLAPTW